MGHGGRLFAHVKEVFAMKTSHLVALMVSLLISFGGITAIDLLFTQAYASHQAVQVALMLQP
jgi:hypothetical protein